MKRGIFYWLSITALLIATCAVARAQAPPAMPAPAPSAAPMPPQPAPKPGLMGQSQPGEIAPTPAPAPAPVDPATALARDQKILSDWANLSRYRDANAQLAPAAPGETRVVFMGDSITDFWAKSPQTFFPGKPYIDRGISGQTTPQMLVRFRADVIALHPKVVVILAGTNDISSNTGPETLEEIEGYLTSMAELARVNGIRVVLASLTPVTDAIMPQTVRRPPEKIVALNVWIKSYAESHHIIYLDYYSAMLDDKQMLRQDLTRDGLHPNDAGYAIMEPLAEKAIEAALR
ncbi:MAG: SGNH/GDSL hydrolase family protein [Candidatus Acidiferrales bacterium]